jgi:hypothetical protein
LTANQVTAEDEEKIDPDPAEPMHLAGQREAHDAGVVNDDDDNRESAEKIEARLALAVREARIDRTRGRRSKMGIQRNEVSGNAATGRGTRGKKRKARRQCIVCDRRRAGFL